MTERMSPAERLLARIAETTDPEPRPRPLARSSDPETSKVAAAFGERQRVRRPGTVSHRILRIYDQRGYVPVGPPTYGFTAAEIDAKLDGRHRSTYRRVYDLLADGLLREDLEGGEPHVRDGSRVLRITPEGRAELRRLDAAAAGD